MRLTPRRAVPPAGGAAPPPAGAVARHRRTVGLAAAAVCVAGAGAYVAPRLAGGRATRATVPAAVATHAEPATTAPAAVSAGAAPNAAVGDTDAGDADRVREAALDADGFRLLVSLAERRLVVLDGPDTVRVAPVGVGMDSTLAHEGRVWRFQTPRGVRRVRRKDADPRWVPPEWHYVEVARARGLRLARLPAEGYVVVDDTTDIVVQDGEIGLVRDGTPFTPFAADEEVIWQRTLYIPPVGTPQREVAGELGRYRLDLGDGYLLHGTPHRESVGAASSHGCLRIGDDDVAWLYAQVPVGTPVYVY